MNPQLRPPYILVQSEVEESHYKQYIGNANIDEWSFTKPMPNNEMDKLLKKLSLIP